MAWRSKKFNIQNIQHQTASAMLINMPHSSKYDGYCFWHPLKLVRDGSHSYERTFSYSETFEFKLRKYGKGKYNSADIISELDITCEQMDSVAFV